MPRSLFSFIRKADKKLLLLILGVIVYFPTFFNGFVMDDQGLILKNLNVHSIGNLFNFFRGSIFDYGGSLGGIYYRPMMTTYFSIIYTFFGPYPFYYHAFQLILHMVTSIFVFILLKKYLREVTAFFLAVVFLIHPIQAEAVSYNAAVQDILFVLFGLIFLNKLHDSKNGIRRFLPYVFILFSVFSKEAGFLFLPLGLLYIYLHKKKDVVAHLIVSVGVFLTYLIMRFGVARVMMHTTHEFPMMRLDFFERAVSIPQIVFYYIKTFFFPYNLVSVQSWTVNDIGFENFFIPLIALFLLFGFLILSTIRLSSKAKKGEFLLFWTWFISGVLLHVQIVPLDLTVSDRWFYFPLIGFLGLLGVTFELSNARFVLKKKRIYVVSIFLLVFVLLFYATRSFLRVTNWKDTKVLAINDLKIQEDNYQLLSALGAMYLDEKNYPMASKYTEASVKIFPYWGTSYYNLGVSYHLDNKIEKAENAYKKSIENAKANINAYENLAILYVYNYPPERARNYARESLRNFPNSAKLWHVLAIAEQKLGNDAASTEAARMLNLLSSPSSRVR